MTFPSDDEIVSDLDEDTISFSREECAALLRECSHSYISYENPIARLVIKRMVDFVDEQ